MSKKKDKHKSASKKNLKAKKAKAKGKELLDYYCVAVIDILGQKDKLREFREFPETKEEKEQFNQMIKETFWAVDELRISFKAHYKAFSSEKMVITSAADDRKEIFKKLRNHDIGFQGFSDSTFTAVPLKHNPIGVNGVYAVLMAAASVFTTHLKNGLPIRGGIEVGIAGYTRDGDIYGSALNNAHYLECRIAKQPRIVIGDELVSYLDRMKKLEGTDEEAHYVRVMAKACESIIGEDIDGIKIIDYMGKGILQMMNGDEALKDQFIDLLLRIKEFLVEQKQKWKSKEEKSRSEDEKKELSERYQHAIDYYESRIHLWD